MANIINNLYNSPSRVSLKELFLRRVGVTIPAELVTYTFDDVSNHLTVTAVPRYPDGTLSPWIGSVTYPLTRISISAQLPNPLVWSGNYPPTVQQLADYLMAAYGYYLEDGEFSGVGDATNTPLVRGGTVLATLDPTTLTFQLTTTAQALRWLPGSILHFRQVTSNSIGGVNGLAFTNTPPQGVEGQPYDFTYTVANGVLPYTFSIIEGTPPAPLNAATGRLYSANLTTTGSFTWTVQVVDAAGSILTVTNSITVIYPALTINPPTTSPVVSVGVPVNIALGVSGGSPPYTYSTFIGTIPSTLSIVSGSLVGTLEGTLNPTSTTLSINLGLTVTDSLGVSAQRLFVITVNDRTSTQITAALNAKLLHWFNQAPSAYDPQGVAASYIVGDAWRDLTGKLALTVDSAPLTAVPGPGSALWKGLDMSAGYANANTVAYNLPEDFAVVSWLNFAGASGSGQHIAGRGADANGGWAVERVAPGNALGLGLTMSGVPELSSFAPTLSTNPGDWYFSVVQMKGNVPELEINAGSQYLDTAVVGTLTPNTTNGLYVGIAPSLLAATKYTGSLGQLAIFTDKLWSDERKWLYNAGAGRLFTELGYFPAMAISGTYADPTENFTYGGDLTVSGGSGTYTHGQLVSGTLPPGLAVANNLTGSGNLLHLAGAATALGTYTFTVGAYSTDGQFATSAQSVTVLSPPLTWDGSAAGPEVVLSNNNFTLYSNSAGWSTAYGTVGRTSGKWQFEVSVTGSSVCVVGVADKTNLTTQLTQAVGQVAYGNGIRNNGTEYLDSGSAGGYDTVIAGYGPGDVLGIALDIDGLTWSVYLNGVLGVTRSIPTGHTWYPAASASGGESIVLQSAALTHPVSGFSRW